MSRAFSKQEKEELKSNLIEIFLDELNHKKISSINVDGLVEKVGIGKGSFYLLFKSKDELFGEVVNKIQDEIVSNSLSIVRKSSTSSKNKFKKVLMFLVDTVCRYPWIEQLSNVEYARVISRLPKETKEKLQEKDITDLTLILDKLQLKSEHSYSYIVTMIQIILSSALNRDDFGAQYDKSVQIMIDILVEGLFKENGDQ